MKCSRNLAAHQNVTGENDKGTALTQEEYCTPHDCIAAKIQQPIHPRPLGTQQQQNQGASLHSSAAENALQGIYVMAAHANSQAIMMMASGPPSMGKPAHKFMVHSRILTISVSEKSVGGPSDSVGLSTHFYTKHYTEPCLSNGGVRPTVGDQGQYVLKALMGSPPTSQTETVRIFKCMMDLCTRLPKDGVTEASITMAWDCGSAAGPEIPGSVHSDAMLPDGPACSLCSRLLGILWVEPELLGYSGSTKRMLSSHTLSNRAAHTPAGFHTGRPI